MNIFENYLTIYGTPTSEYPFGYIIDDPGGGTGSEAIAKTVNDLAYAQYAVVDKYKTGGPADTNETVLASDMVDAIEEMVAIQINGVNEWSVSTEYAEDDAVMRYGIQFISLASSNIGNDPLLKPNFWLPCLSFSEAFNEFQKGNVKEGGLHRIHDWRNTSGSYYKQWFPYGIYNIGGVNGKTFEVFGVHLDGTQITGDTDLENIFDPGGANEYHLLNLISDETAGPTWTLKDTKDRVMRVVGDGVGSSENVGVVQEDAFQGHRHAIYKSGQGTIYPPGATSNSILAAVSGATAGPIQQTEGAETSDPFQDRSGNGTPRTDDETRMKNYTVGVPYIIVIKEVP